MKVCRGGEAMTLDIPNYRIIEKLGVGAQSRIFRARCMRTGKDYAVKTVKVQKPEDMTIVEMMRAEHAIGSAIDHPNVRKVYELRMIRHRLRTRGAILFMEYVDGVPISDPQFQDSLEGLLGLFRQVAVGLQALHLAGYVHADLKPANMLVTPDREVKLIDLGQSADIRQAKQRIQGTVDYMAPEQADRKVLDERTDIFGLGATIHRVLTGKPVATAMNQTVNLSAPMVALKNGRTNGNPMLAKLPVPIERLLQDCCAPNPADGPKDMGAFAQRLDLILTSMKRQATAVDEPADPNYDDYDLDDDAYDYVEAESLELDD